MGAHPGSRGLRWRRCLGDLKPRDKNELNIKHHLRLEHWSKIHHLTVTIMRKGLPVQYWHGSDTPVCPPMQLPPSLLKKTLNPFKLAQARHLEGTAIARITVDTEGVGLCLISTKKIQGTESKPIKLWEYTWEVKPVQNDENSNSIPLQELKFG